MEELMSDWWFEAVVYHLFPLGFCGAPHSNDFSAPAENRITRILDILDSVNDMGFNTLLLGPVFESTSHGYDTVDWYHIDRRLGSSESFALFAHELHARGMRLILDGVFNHVGRDFWAFHNLRSLGTESPYRSWFSGVDFSRQSAAGDSFDYEGWEGHSELVTLNLRNAEVKQHIFGAIEKMYRLYGIHGLRLDVAYSLDDDFIRELSAFCRGLSPDFRLLGEVVHGDYRQWVYPGGLDSVTNYECYKGIYSSHNDGNFYEISYSLNRLFGDDGTCRGMRLYNFVDNHDVSRIATVLTEERYLSTAHALLFTIPGVPSIYYGSEGGTTGVKVEGPDWHLRPSAENINRHDTRTAEMIQGLIRLRRRYPALRHGDYRQVHVDHRQFAFCRVLNEECVLVMVNSDLKPVQVPIADPVLQKIEDSLTGEPAGSAPMVGSGAYRIFANR